jgi:hypothetical protein
MTFEDVSNMRHRQDWKPLELERIWKKSASIMQLSPTRKPDVRGV